jgi:hypothetical protein
MPNRTPQTKGITSGILIIIIMQNKSSATATIATSMIATKV